MIVVDVNLLVYATIRDLPQHRAAHEWLDTRLNLRERVGLPWSSLVGFLRLVTHPRLFSHPLATAEAWQVVDRWLSCDGVWIPLPAARHREILGAILLETGARSDLVPDAHLAALAIEHDAVLCSTDRDFSRFRTLRWQNPLMPSGREGGP